MAAPEEVTFMEEFSAKESAVAGENAASLHRSGNSPAVVSDECEMLSIVIHREASSCPPDTTDQWLQSMMKDGSTSNKKQKPRIQKVPRMLRKIESNENCYEPQVVSIGPYHHGKLELEAVEKLKVPMARDYIQSCNTSKLSVREMYDKVAAVAVEARQCYAKDATEGLDDEAFAQMMFLDGCFILQFIYCYEENKHAEMKMRSLDIAFVRRDLFLLENQLPFLVLKELVSLRFEQKEGINKINSFIEHTRALPPPGKPGWRQRIENCIDDCNFLKKPLENSKNQPVDEEGPAHLLDLLRAQLINLPDKKIATKSISRSSLWHSYRSVKELKTAGIKFRPSNTQCYTDIRFEQGCVEGFVKLPPVTVDDSTKSTLLNLVAYEACPDAPDDLGVTSYICFMDSLIDHAEDVKELRSKGILLNFLGSDQQVADLFNEIANDLVDNPELHKEVKTQIEEHHKNKMRVWIKEGLHTHFSSPWTVLAFLGAIVAIVLTSVQTYYAVFPQK
ncbi:UPF0481 protein At3g47200-like [Malania oleifera]|uniref:UPF0481 protein At3g47200-like n=1 Tax=Malania oleifera TaxID=397392 RepID=UPI0025AE0004|nr:UPF0481 protein At3g47200-like [Malania oleifera]